PAKATCITSPPMPATTLCAPCNGSITGSQQLISKERLHERAIRVAGNVYEKGLPREELRIPSVGAENCEGMNCVIVNARALTSGRRDLACSMDGCAIYPISEHWILPYLHPQRRHRLRRRQAHRELVLGAAADLRILIAVLPHPDYPLRIHVHLFSVHILKHDKLHKASLSRSWRHR